MNKLLYPRAVASHVLKKFLIFQGFHGLEKHANISFSQMGEDRVLSLLFERKKNGFYVDIGAYDPKLYSNTYLFYLQGWHGINIEPRPGAKKQFDKVRPRDINLEIPIASKEAVALYYMFDGAALNTFSKGHAEIKSKNTQYKIIDMKKIKTFTLESILDKYQVKAHQIDFLSIDVEGNDLEVLRSNNWVKYQPRVIVVEDLDTQLEKYHSSKVYQLLHKQGYYLFSKTYHSFIFIEKGVSV